MTPGVTERIHIGDVIDFDSEIDTTLSMVFLPLDFFDHWDRGSVLANFVAEYFRHNFPDEGAHNLVSTVLNELIENSVKFSKNNSMPVKLTARKRRNSLMMKVENCLPSHRMDRFLSLCRELFTRDLDDLYVQRLQTGLTDTRASGIGLILIRKDYSTALSFDFLPGEDCPVRVAVTAELDFEAQRRHE